MVIFAFIVLYLVIAVPLVAAPYWTYLIVMNVVRCIRLVICFFRDHAWQKKHFGDAAGGEVRVARVCKRCGKTEWGIPF
jgi:hypothetical protein